MTTMANVLIPRTWRRTQTARLLLDAALILAGSVLVALSARVAIPLPFTPVPVTAQTFAVLLVGAALGSRRGALALVAYLAEGAAGMPVFSGGGCCVAWLAGPTAGYLWSYPLAAFTVGALAERGWDRSPGRAGLAMLAGNGVIYVVALPWLASFVGAGQVLEAGLLPFIPGDLLKVALAAAALPAAWAVVGRVRPPHGPGGD
jgi:biotin transport system substrate-specific component